MYGLLRRALFALDPETAHAVALQAARLAGQVGPVRAAMSAVLTVRDPRLRVDAWRISFDNPVGLAAGYDKDGVALAGLAALGFGHVEVGTVTVAPQAGNPRPRLHRLPEDAALVNSLGFPNAGADALHLERVGVRVGINLGKGRDTPLERAAEDYCALLRRLHGCADYVVVNVSSPNTPGLRELQGREHLAGILQAVLETRRALGSAVPVLVKVAPDLDLAQLDDVVEVVLERGVDGIIACNTTLRRDGLRTPAPWPGGLSGAPLRARSTAVVAHLARQTRGRLPILGVGGVASAADALEKLRAGAWMVQLYTGLVYAGPGLVRQINRGILAEMERLKVTGMTELRQALADPGPPARHNGHDRVGPSTWGLRHG